jgi:hypothetical protein
LPREFCFSGLSVLMHSSPGRIVRRDDWEQKLVAPDLRTLQRQRRLSISCWPLGGSSSSSAVKTALVQPKPASFVWYP